MKHQITTYILLITIFCCILQATGYSFYKDTLRFAVDICTNISGTDTPCGSDIEFRWSIYPSPSYFSHQITAPEDTLKIVSWHWYLWNKSRGTLLAQGEVETFSNRVSDLIYIKIEPEQITPQSEFYLTAVAQLSDIPTTTEIRYTQLLSGKISSPTTSNADSILLTEDIDPDNINHFFDDEDLDFDYTPLQSFESPFTQLVATHALQDDQEIAGYTFSFRETIASLAPPVTNSSNVRVYTQTLSFQPYFFFQLTDIPPTVLEQFGAVANLTLLLNGPATFQLGDAIDCTANHVPTPLLSRSWNGKHILRIELTQKILQDVTRRRGIYFKCEKSLQKGLVLTRYGPQHSAMTKAVPISIQYSISPTDPKFPHWRGFVDTLETDPIDIDNDDDDASKRTNRWWTHIIFLVFLGVGALCILALIFLTCCVIGIKCGVRMKKEQCIGIDQHLGRTCFCYPCKQQVSTFDHNEALLIIHDDQYATW